MKHKLDVVDLAYQVIAMQQRIDHLESENERLEGYEKKYNELLDSSINHGQHMIQGILAITMVPGVLDAISNNNSATERA